MVTKVSIPAIYNIPSQKITIPACDVMLPGQSISLPAQYVFEVDGDAASSTPTPVATSALYMPSSAADLQAKWQAALDNGKMLMTHPDMDLDVTSQMALTIRTGSGGKPHGLMAHGGRLNWKTDDWHQSVVQMTLGVQFSRGLRINDLTIDGGGFVGNQSMAGLRIIADEKVGGIYQFQINGFVGEFCTHSSINIEGNVFEGQIDSPAINGFGDAGLIFRQLPVQDPVNLPSVAGVLSNITVRTPNIRGGNGWGIFCDGAKSVDVVGGGSFINNTLGGIWATLGIRLVDGPNFENCGPVAMRMDDAADGLTKIINCSGSNTLGKMPYLIEYHGAANGLYQVGNSMYAGSVMKP